MTWLLTLRPRPPDVSFHPSLTVSFLKKLIQAVGHGASGPGLADGLGRTIPGPPAPHRRARPRAITLPETPLSRRESQTRIQIEPISPPGSQPKDDS